METNNTYKRNKRIMMIVMLVCLFGAQIIIAYSSRIPLPQRVIWFNAGVWCFSIPVGFVYGRNSMRKDKFRKLSLFFLCLMLGILLLSFFQKSGYNFFKVMSSGFLIGYALGWLVSIKSVKKFGDTIEADQYLNIARSERVPSTTQPHLAYLNSLDQQTRKTILSFVFVEMLVFLSGIVLGFWIGFGNYLSVVTRFLYLHPHDGTVFFFATDPFISAIPLAIIFEYSFFARFERLVQHFMGQQYDAWLEYSRLRPSKKTIPMSPRVSKIINRTIIAISILVTLLSTSNYVKVTSDGIEVKKLLEVKARFYNWSDIRNVEYGWHEYSMGNGKTGRYFDARVFFKDGTKWEPDTSPAMYKPDIEKAFQYIASRRQ